MHNHYKHLFLTATLAFTGQAFSQGTATPSTNARTNLPNGRAMMPIANPVAAQTPGSTQALKPCASVQIDPPTHLTLGKSRVVRLDFPAARMLVGGQSSSRAGRATEVDEQSAAAAASMTQPAGGSAQRITNGVADTEITLLSPTELFFLGKRAGSMNVVLQGADGRCVIKDFIVTIDPETLQSKIAELMPDETGIKVRAAENAIVLTGKVSDAIKLDEVISLATAYGDGKKVVNMLRIGTPQQVMLEVKIAEVSKTLLDKFGASVGINRTYSGGANSYSLLSNFLSNGGGLLQALRIGRSALNIDGQKDDGLMRILAEPNIMAISGQAASFLSGGKIFIPVAQDSSSGKSTITLQEKEFGIGVKFTPIVLDGTRINLKMVSEVSELSQTGSPFTTVSGVTSVLPSFSVRRADTTVQLNDGQSFVIAGLIKNNFSETIKRFPGLGEVPVIGPLFRSSEFQNDQTELLFVVTPRLVKPLAESPRLPTDNHVVPSRTEVIFGGQLEGAEPAPAAPVPVAPVPVAPAPEIK